MHEEGHDEDDWDCDCCGHSWGWMWGGIALAALGLIAAIVASIILFTQDLNIDTSRTYQAWNTVAIPAILAGLVLVGVALVKSNACYCDDDCCSWDEGRPNVKGPTAPPLTPAPSA